MRLERLPDAQAVAERAADLLARTLDARPEAVVLLPAGATPVPLYAEIVRRARRGDLDLTRARLFQLDELVGVATEDPQSFHGYFRRHLLEPLALGGFHGLDGSTPSPEREIERHRLALERCGGADMALLGLGGNGHVAFNEPGSRLDQPARVVELGEWTRRGLAPCFNGATSPRRGITLGLAEIAASRRIALLVTGASKAGVLSAVLGDDATSALPAALLRPHPGLVVLADEMAARG